MSLEQVFSNALEEVTNIYMKSKYDPETDLYRSFDLLNSLNKNQFASKRWLVEKLTPYIPKELNTVCVLGSWYGLTSILLREVVGPDVHIVNIDTDPSTREIGLKLIKGIDAHEKTYFKVDDAVNYFFSCAHDFQLIINTSCEHMDEDDIRLIVEAKHRHATVCFQGNNYHSVQSHINTHNNLQEFIDSVNLVQLDYSEALKAPNGKYDRYMVIGQ